MVLWCPHILQKVSPQIRWIRFEKMHHCASIVQFYLIHVGIRVLFPLHLWKDPLKTIVFKEREGGKNRTKKPNQTKKKACNLFTQSTFVNKKSSQSKIFFKKSSLCRDKKPAVCRYSHLMKEEALRWSPWMWG